MKSPTSLPTPMSGIFCLEGAWDTDLRDTATVEPVLELLHKLGVTDYLHRDTVTADQFGYYLQEWSTLKYARYRILYLSAHGAGSAISLGAGWDVPLEEVAERLRGKARGRVIHFAGCSTLDIDDHELTRFAQVTEAAAITGYQSPVKWTEAAASEVLLLTRLTSHLRSHAFVNDVTTEMADLAEQLGLVVATPGEVYRAGALEDLRPSRSA